MGVVVVTQRVVGARARQVRRLWIVETGDQPAQARQRLLAIAETVLADETPYPSARLLWLRNEGTEAEPKLAAPQPILADGKPASVEGRPGQMLADFDGDGDLDLLCGEFLDGFTYFQNTGSKKEPRYAAGRRLTRDGVPLTVDLEMLVPHAIDWDGDGDIDLIVGDEDGREIGRAHV